MDSVHIIDGAKHEIEGVNHNIDGAKHEIEGVNNDIDGAKFQVVKHFVVLSSQI